MGALNGKLFGYTSNNGVMAIAPMEIIENRRDVTQIRIEIERTFVAAGHQTVLRGLSHMKQYPIFTFCDHYGDMAPWYTGHCAMYRALLGYIQAEGGKIENTSFYVPFSNQLERGIHGAEATKREMRFVTESSQFRDAFGLFKYQFVELARQRNLEVVA